MKGRGEGREAVVIIADRQHTWGETGQRTRSGVPKMRGVMQNTGKNRAGWFALFTADDTEQANRVLDKAQVLADELMTSGPVPPTHDAICRLVERAYREAAADWTQYDFERPDQTRSAFDPTLLVCGFSSEDNIPALYEIGVDQRMYRAHDTGWVTGGEGEDMSRHYMNWNKTGHLDSLPKVLFDCYAAKRHAQEGFTSISEETDFLVLVIGCEQPQRVPDDIAEGVEIVFNEVRAASIAFPESSPKTPSWGPLRDRIDKWFRNGKIECVD